MLDLVNVTHVYANGTRALDDVTLSIPELSSASLEKRYGWEAGLPALLVASFVGVARVRADKHYIHDVLAGAVIGGASGFLLTARHDDRVRLTPWAGSGGGGIDVAMRF